MPAAIARLVADDAAAFRDLRLEGLRGHPEAFGASLEDEAAQPLDWFARRLTDGAVFGGRHGDGTLYGVAGFLRHGAAKLRHKGVLWGMFVRPEARRTGLSAALVQAVLDHARTEVEEVLLTVVASNAPAVRLYAKAGFVQYGLERRALRVGDAYHDEMLMACALVP